METIRSNAGNAKRVPAEDSVCIRKGSVKAASSNLSTFSNWAANGEEPGLYRKDINWQDKESAETWFDDSNKNVSSECGQKFYAGKHVTKMWNFKLTLIDEDPPFFLRNKSSSNESLPIPPKIATQAANCLPKEYPNSASLLSRNRGVESSSEDFRSIIDDLTIENRKLKKRLRIYERAPSGDLQSDKLFEIRVHGLPASKKRKLEKALQEFTLGLGDTPDEEPSAFAQNLARVATKKPPLHHNASSSGTSNSRMFVDSAYASMSNSSNACVSRRDSNQDSMVAQANDQAVRSYLHSLSRGLLPKRLPALTETTKKQVVVRRLEQLFTGSRDRSCKDSQSKQQQEVSQSAATADRKTSEAKGQRVTREGRRESKILTTEEEVKNGTKLFAVERDDTESSEAATSSDATPDQRPTRPLDLDPSRAQVSEDNIEYMKHLGFGSPLMQANKTLDDDEGWIYLNLLTGMAQLHILNVTPEFVRSAVRDISTQFELSTDGTRIRWKGGNGPTLISSDSGELSAHSSSDSSNVAIAPTDNSKSGRSAENQSGFGCGNNHLSNNHSSNDRPSSYGGLYKRRPMLLSQTNPMESHQYRPLFHHDNHSDDSSGHSCDEKDSTSSSRPINSVTINQSGDPGNANNSKKTSYARAGKRIDPIIFYNKAKFYTDLSKDDESMPYNCPLYTKISKSVVGIREVSDDFSYEEKGPISKPQAGLAALSLEFSDSPLILGGLMDSTQTWSTDKAAKSPTRFEASGIGGVVPGDHFTIDVEMCVEQSTASKKISSKIVSSMTTEMLPSKLPPPSYAFLPFSNSSNDGMDDSDGDEDINMDNEDAYEQDIKAYIPPKFLNSFSSEESNEGEEDDAMSDDSSIDMLAHAREMEPDIVAAAEREFDNYISSGGEDPPASSIVATLGDQSFEKEDSAEKHGSVQASRPEEAFK